LSGQRSPNQPRHQARNRRPAARLPLLRHLEALTKEHPIPWRSKRARSFPMPAVQNRLRQQCRAAANPWKLAPTARRIPNQSSSRKSESPAGCCSVDRTLHPRDRVGLVDHDHPPQIETCYPRPLIGRLRLPLRVRGDGLAMSALYFCFTPENRHFITAAVTSALCQKLKSPARAIIRVIGYSFLTRKCRGR
jgi:hypothetical protein